MGGQDSISICFLRGRKTVVPNKKLVCLNLPCRLALRRRFASIQPCTGRQLYIRIFFHDEGEESAHWFGIASKHGTCAVGVSTTSRQYMVANGTCPGALPGTQNVTQGNPTCLHRSRGWRVFEVVFEEGMVSIAIDGRGVFAGIAKGARQASDDHLWIIAQTGTPVRFIWVHAAFVSTLSTTELHLSLSVVPNFVYHSGKLKV